ncbi:MAG: hypothetical protein ABDH23_04370 [Endomicrobiia bacterium]
MKIRSGCVVIFFAIMFTFLIFNSSARFKILCVVCILFNVGSVKIKSV